MPCCPVTVIRSVCWQQRMHRKNATWWRLEDIQTILWICVQKTTLMQSVNDSARDRLCWRSNRAKLSSKNVGVRWLSRTVCWSEVIIKKGFQQDYQERISPWLPIFKELAWFAYKVSGVMCSVSACEHCWSIEGWIHSKRRNKLHQKLVEKLVRTHTNLVLRVKPQNTESVCTTREKETDRDTFFFKKSCPAKNKKK